MRSPIRQPSLTAACLVFSMFCLKAEGDLGRGRASFDLDGSSMQARILLGEAEGSRLGLAMAADGRLAELRGLFCLRSRGEGPQASLLAGPGSAAGPVRLLADPTSFSPGFRLGPPAEADPSLESATSVIACEAGPVALFALARGSSPGLLVARPGPASLSSRDGPGSKGSVFETAAGGFCLGPRGEEGGWALVGASSLRRGRKGGDGWRPDPPPDAGGQVLVSGLVAERRWQGGRSSAGAELSWGRLEGPGIAARLEAEAGLGFLALRVAAGAAAESFRNLYGEESARRLGLACDARLALRRSAFLSAAYRLESPRSGPGGPPRLERSLATLLELPLLSAPGGGSAELGIELGGDEAFRGDSRFSLALSRGGESASPLWRIGVYSCLLPSRPSPRSVLGPVGASFMCRSCPSPESPGPEPFRLEAELGLEALADGLSSAPVIAKGSLGIGLALDRASVLSLAMSLPPEGLELRPRQATAPGPGLVFSVAYRSRIGP